jgi:hypothetical protein
MTCLSCVLVQLSTRSSSCCIEFDVYSSNSMMCKSCVVVNSHVTVVISRSDEREMVYMYSCASFPPWMQWSANFCCTRTVVPHGTILSHQRSKQWCQMDTESLAFLTKVHEQSAVRVSLTWNLCSKRHEWSCLQVKTCNREWGSSARAVPASTYNHEWGSSPRAVQANTGSHE